MSTPKSIDQSRDPGFHNFGPGGIVEVTYPRTLENGREVQGRAFAIVLEDQGAGMLRLKVFRTPKHNLGSLPPFDVEELSSVPRRTAGVPIPAWRPVGLRTGSSVKATIERWTSSES